MRASTPPGTPGRRRAVGTVTAGLLAFAGCGDDGRETVVPDGPPDLAVTGTDGVTFEPDTFEIGAGEEITIELTSQPGLEHDVVVAGVAAAGRISEEGDDHDTDDHDSDDDNDLHVVHASAGQASRATFVIDEPGTYEIYCSIPGHRESGMTGALTVIDGG